MYVFLKLSSRSRHVFLPVRENVSSDVSRADEPHAENAMGRGVPVILPGRLWMRKREWNPAAY
jgi:hypothetical protein